MVSLTIWTFTTPYGAEAVAVRLRNLCARELIRLDDAALVSWPEGRPLPLLRPLTELPRGWILDDAFWGLLAGMLFHRAQLPAWQARGVISDSLATLGISAAVLSTMRARVVEGTSALLLLVDAENARRIAQAIDGMTFTFVEAPLSSSQEQRLRSTFGAHTD